MPTVSLYLPNEQYSWLLEHESSSKVVQDLIEDEMNGDSDG